jgi:hypothetical protein
VKSPATTNQRPKAAFRIGKSKTGKFCVWVTRPGELIPTEYGFRTEDEARAWAKFQRKQGAFDRPSE